MSLNWDISEVRDHEELFVPAPDDPGMTVDYPHDGVWLDGLTQALIFASMATGLGKNWSLDADYAPEFYARVKLLEALGGPLAHQGGKDYSVTPADIERRIGLKVNVSPRTRAAFLKTVQNDLDSFKRQYERETKKVEAEQ